MAGESVTRERDLRSGEPLWARSHGIKVPARRLRKAISADVAIVGAGISGALMAYELSRDHSVVVLDRRPPLRGSTLASTALLQWEIDLPLTVLAQRIGLARAKRAYARSARAVADLRALVGRERLRCGFEVKSTLYLAGDAYGHRALEAEAEARAALGLGSRYLHAEALREQFGVSRTGAIMSSGSASANPAQLAAGLLRRATARGTAIFSPIEVQAAYEDPEGVTLTTGEGIPVRAGRVVFCSGYEFPEALDTRGSRIASTWALASRVGLQLPAWLKSTLIWEASDPYLYLRSTPDRRLVAGGEDEASGTAHADQAKLDRKARVIARKLRSLLPGVEFEIDHVWAGAFGESVDGLPTIGQVPGRERIWVVEGFGGNGITYSMIASQIIGAAFRGAPDTDADLYRPR